MVLVELGVESTLECNVWHGRGRWALRYELSTTSIGLLGSGWQGNKGRKDVATTIRVMNCILHSPTVGLTLYENCIVLGHYFCLCML